LRQALDVGGGQRHGELIKNWANNWANPCFAHVAKALVDRAIGYYLAFVTRALRVN
jgi:hypothetical protein